MPDFYSWVKPFLWRLDPEKAHRLSILALKLVPSQWFSQGAPDQILEQSLWGMAFKNPIGLAAGYDKNAEVVRPLFELGFGFVEVGGVTLRPQSGNPQPRLFRLTEDQAVINRMGLNSAGVELVAKSLEAQQSCNLPGPFFVNLGLNKDSRSPASEYAELAGKMAPFANVLTLNVSSPNTPGLRALQETSKLMDIVGAVRGALAASESSTAPVLLIKIAPDLSDEDLSDLAQFSINQKIDGLVVSNTTVARPNSLRSVHRHEAGGLSGKPLFEASTEVLRKMYEWTDGEIPIIGVGGVSTGADAYAKIRAGASLVQLYSALVYEGPSLVSRVSQDLANHLKSDGFASIADAVGADHRSGGKA